MSCRFRVIGQRATLPDSQGPLPAVGLWAPEDWDQIICGQRQMSGQIRATSRNEPLKLGREVVGYLKQDTSLSLPHRGMGLLGLEKGCSGVGGNDQKGQVGGPSQDRWGASQPGPPGTKHQRGSLSLCAQRPTSYQSSYNQSLDKIHPLRFIPCGWCGSVG